jgi:hypothetical protein
MTKLKSWIADKWGRLVTAVGAAASAAGTALAVLPDSPDVWMPHLVTLTSAKVAAGVMLTLLFIASHMRHRKAAATVNALTLSPP